MDRILVPLRHRLDRVPDGKAVYICVYTCYAVDLCLEISHKSLCSYVGALLSSKLDFLPKQTANQINSNIDQWNVGR